MNGSKAGLTTLEIVAMFVLSLLVFMGCTVGREATVSPLPAFPSSAEPMATRGEEVSSSHATAQPPSERTLVSAPAKPFDQALLDAAHSLLSLMELPPPGEKQLLVIDSPIDGNSGVQSLATRKIEARIGELVRKKYQHLSLQPFTPANVQRAPLVLLGTLTPTDGFGQTNGKREIYRLCLVLADLKSRTVVSKETARAQIHGVNHTPTPYFQDSPAWMRERMTESYVHICEASKPGDRIPSAYIDGILTQALINEAIVAYDSGRYQQALERYSSAAETAAGDQLRVHNGIYLANLKLNRSAAAAAAFGKIVEYGLSNNQLAVKFLFKPGSAAFAPDNRQSENYSTWVKEIAQRAIQNNACLEIIGHSSRTGSETVNEKLSLQRAEYVKKKLEAEIAELSYRTVANGAGSRENLVGTGKDDPSDALDRRVVFQVVPCAKLATQTANRQ